MNLADAAPAVEGRDFEVLASYTNEDLDRENGQYFDGVTDDGLILFRDGPRSDQRIAVGAHGPRDWRRRTGCPTRTSGRSRPGRSSSASTG